jgi:NADH-quinone oxidoreductase subunit I
MAIGVKVLERPIAQTSYVRASLQGMALTLRHLLRPMSEKVTIQYPEEKYSVSPRWRGTHRMLTTEDGKAKCVACGLCPTVCPANCIKLVPGEDEKEVCPEEAIHLGRHYENSEYSRDGFVYDLERLMAQTHPVSELWDPADPKGE